MATLPSVEELAVVLTANGYVNNKPTIEAELIEFRNAVLEAAAEVVHEHERSLEAFAGSEGPRMTLRVVRDKIRKLKEDIHG